MQPVLHPANFLETFVLKSILVERDTHTKKDPKPDQTWAQVRWLSRDNLGLSPF